MSLSTSTRKRLIFWLKASIGIILLILVLREVNWQNFWSYFQELSLPLFALLLCLSGADRCLMGYKWNLLLRANGLVISNGRIISLYVISNLLGAFTPGNLGADAYRVVALAPHGKSAAVLSTVVLERAVGMLVLLLFVIGSLPFSFSLLGSEGPTVATMAVVGSVLIVLMLFLPLNPPLRRRVDRFFVGRKGKLSMKIHQFFSVFAEQQKNWRILLIFFILTIIETCLFFYLSYITAKVAGLKISLAFIFSIMPVVMFVLRLPISIQGIGLQEGLFAYTFCLAGNSVTQGVLASLIWRLMDVFAVYIPGYLLFVFSPTVDTKKFRASEVPMMQTDLQKEQSEF